MKKNYNIHEAKTQLSKLISRVIAGEEIIISKKGEPVARLVKIEKTIQKRTPGKAKGIIEIKEGFNDPLPENVLEDFEHDLPS